MVSKGPVLVVPGGYGDIPPEEEGPRNAVEAAVPVLEDNPALASRS